MNKLHAFVAAAGLSLASIPPAMAEVPWPEGWRDWHHVKSMVIEEGHPLFEAFGGIHHLYANDKALEGYRAGTFPDGAVIAFDLLAAEDAGNALVEGERKVLGVMHKDSARWTETNGWGYEGFGGGDPENRVVGDNAFTACHACHVSQAEHDFVFSRLRD
ncbi:MAG: cytochrome P460 family protein [Wenzhouxiangellaceae bacterium]